MSALSIQPTYPIFTETDGLPLENGYIWIGTTNLDPQGNPINVYWDKALTILAPQPIRTINGYPSRSGTPGRLYVNSDYSIRVQNSKGSLVYSAPAATERYNSVVVDLTFTQTGTGAVTRPINSKILEQLPSPEDFGAVGDGVADDTTSMQELFDAHDQVRLLPGKIYSCGRLNINNDLQIFGYDSILLHRTNTAAQGVGLLQMLGDDKLVIRGLRIDGNAANQSALPFTYNFVWCSIGSIEMYDCWCGNTKGTNIRTGNIDNFDASKFAHDIIIDNCEFRMGLSNCGDNLRIERTVRATFSNNFVYGGFSSMRSQLYCKELDFINNECSFAFADMGITTALSENVRIIDNNIHSNFGLGIEIDAVVNCQVTGNYVHDNGLNGIQTAPLGAAYFLNEPTYWGSISTAHGSAYNNQTFTSPYVNNINVSITNNVIANNTRADRLINSVTDFYAYNYVSNPNSTVNAQLGIEGTVITVGQPGFGLITSTSPTVVNNTFVLGANDTQAILMGAYQYTARISGNFVVGNKRLAPNAAIGMLDLNANNKFLLDQNKRSALLLDTADAASKTGFAVTRLTTGSTNFPFRMFGSGQGEKLIRVVARVGAGTQAATIIPQLYDSSGVFVANLLPVAAGITLTTSYQEFIVPVPTSVSVGNQIDITVTVPSAGVDVYFNEINLYMTES
jgi:parallel beta-helix repeat protein